MGMRMFFKLSVVLAMYFMRTAFAFDGSWYRSHATFYGEADASGTMGGACGYGNLYTFGYGTNTAALSTALFNNGASCGQCYVIMCDSASVPQWCLPGTSVTITATNFCPPNWDIPSDNGGWCNPPRTHFDMAQPAFEQIAIYQAGIVPVWYRRVSCMKRGNIRLTLNGCKYFNLILVWNVGGPGSIATITIKGENTYWMQMSRNWGANWQVNGCDLTGQSLSFWIMNTYWQSMYFPEVVPYNWIYSQTYEGYTNFY
ncbi:Expansin-A23 [Carex littledalei]|uniref:Expansin n=1 Tax=Carex littledalei TaxID=544730 RepID=A0A833QKA8_9POAL|nr:Expansin-A23 [Carex littledalei]